MHDNKVRRILFFLLADVDDVESRETYHVKWKKTKDHFSSFIIVNKKIRGKTFFMY